MISIKPTLDRLRKDGTGQIRIRCIYKEKILYLPTGIYVTPNQWNAKANAGSPTWVKPSHPLHMQHNKFLLSRIGRLIQFSQEAIEQGVFHLDDLRTMQSGGWTLGQAVEEYINLEIKSDAYNTIKMYRLLKSRILKFTKGQDIMVTRVDYVFVRGYQKWMTDQGRKSSTIQRGLSYLRTILNFCVRTRQMKADQNPFNSMTLPSATIDKARLDEHELNLILGYKFNGKNHLAFLAARTFALQFYLAGMRIGDMIQIRQRNLNSGRLEYFMDKTGKFMPLPIPDPAMLILEELGDMENDMERFRPERFLLPWMDGNENVTGTDLHKQIESRTFVINRCLKTVAEDLGIEKRLTTHMARHCFAEIARKRSGDLYAISKALGHSDLKITQNYLATFDVDGVGDLLKTLFPAKTHKMDV